MEVEVWTTGGGFFILDVFTYLAAFDGSNAQDTFLYMGLMAGVIFAVAKLAFWGSPRDTLLWFFSCVVVLGLSVGPKARVIVMDTTQPLNIYGAVDNVPWSVAQLASWTSTAGYVLTSKIEQLMSAPNDVSYQSSGMVVGASIYAQASRWRSVAPAMNELLTNFFQNCMVEGANLGLVDLEDLALAPNLGSFITNNAPASLAYFDPVAGTVSSCSAGASSIVAAVNGEVSNLLTQKAAGLFNLQNGATPGVYATKVSNMLSSFQIFMGAASSSATETLSQSMMIHAMDDSIQRFIALSGNTGAMAIYQSARAEAQTRSSYLVSGTQAVNWVPKLKIAFEALYYGAFPLALCLMLTPMAAVVLKGYLGGFVWLASWDPLSAILHSIVIKSAAGDYRDAMLVFDTGGTSQYVMNWANHLGIQSVEQDVGVVAGYLLMSVPFLASALFFGAGRMSGLATSMLAVSQGAAIETGREAATGDISLANLSMNNMAANNASVRNHSYNNTNANKHDTHSFNWDTGQTVVGADGVARTTHGNGAVTYDASRATSRGVASLNLRKSVGSGVQERVDASTRAAESSVQALSTSMSQTISSFAGNNSSSSFREMYQQGDSMRSGSSQSKEVNHAIDVMDSFAKNNGLTSQQTLALGMHTPNFGKLIPLQADSRFQGFSDEQVQQLQNAAERAGLHDATRTFTEAASDESLSTNTGYGTESSEGQREALDDLKSATTTAQTSMETAEALSNAHTYNKEQGVYENFDYTNYARDYLAKQGLSDSEIGRVFAPQNGADYRHSRQWIAKVSDQIEKDLGVAPILEGKIAAPNLEDPAAITSFSAPTSTVGDDPLADTRSDFTERHSGLRDGQDGTMAGSGGIVRSKASDRTGHIEGQLQDTPADVVGRSARGGVNAMIESGQSVYESFFAADTNTDTGLVRQPLDYTDRDLHLSTLTVLGEAANQGPIGQEAVAHVLYNRTMDADFPSTPGAVSTAGNGKTHAFSVWNRDGTGNDIPSRYGPGDPAYDNARAIVQEVFDGNRADVTEGATHYYSPAGMDAYVEQGYQSNRIPTWLREERDRRGAPDIHIEDHVFTGLATIPMMKNTQVRN